MNQVRNHSMSENASFPRTYTLAQVANASVSHAHRYNQLHPKAYRDGRFPQDFRSPKLVEEIRVMDRKAQHSAAYISRLIQCKCGDRVLAWTAKSGGYHLLVNCGRLQLLTPTAATAYRARCSMIWQPIEDFVRMGFDRNITSEQSSVEVVLRHGFQASASSF